MLFSLYLMNDAFYRWDGFSYYSTFFEFLPSVSLASILWSVISIISAVIVWQLFRLVVRLCVAAGYDVKAEHLLLFTFIFVLAGGLAWKMKKVIWPYAETTIYLKLSVLLAVSLLSVAAAWLLRGRAGQWTSAFISSITPLVWLFGMFVLLSVPLVAYHALVPASPGSSEGTLSSPLDDSSRPNILLVTFDALSARNMSLYGYGKETTPFINEWAGSSTVFRAAEAGSNFTTPTVATLMTGKRVWTHQTYHIEGTRPVRSGVESLPGVLKEYGYYNAALVVNPFASVRMLGISESFDAAPNAAEFGSSGSLFGWKFGTVDRFLYRLFGDRIKRHNWIFKNDFILGRMINLFSRNITETPVAPEKAFDEFLRMLDGKLPEPFFVWIHVFPPHDPYLPPSLSGEEGRVLPMATYKEQEKLIEHSYDYLFEGKTFPADMKPAVELMRDYYDEFILYCDKQFGEFISEFERRAPEDTIVVLSSDHGESFDHGYFTHGGPFLYEQVTNIPLVIREPGQRSGIVIEDVVEQTDIPSTILDLAGIQPPSWMEGRSLLPLIRGEALPERPVFSMNLQENRSLGHSIVNGSIAVWEGDDKLIHYLESGESLLYNLNEDPEEMNDLFDAEREKGVRLLGIVMEGLRKANERIALESNGR